MSGCSDFYRRELKPPHLWKASVSGFLPVTNAFSAPTRPQTAEILRALMAERGDCPLPEDPLFRNHRGSRLTRFGVRYILSKYCARAHAARPALANKRLHPHSMRHSTGGGAVFYYVFDLLMAAWPSTHSNLGRLVRCSNVRGDNSNQRNCYGR